MASTDKMTRVDPPPDQSTLKQNPKTFRTEYLDCHERKSLQILQQSALSDKALVGVGLTHSESNRNGKPGEKMKIRPIPGPVKIFQDGDGTQKPAEGHKHKRKPASTDSKATQTDDSLLEDLIHEHLEQGSKRDHSLVEAEEDEAVELMVKEPVPEGYWKEIAEQRRLALNDTLEENKSLHEELDSLKEENDKLLELASQAESLSSLLQSVVSDEEDDSGAVSEEETVQKPQNPDDEVDPDPADVSTEEPPTLQRPEKDTKACSSETETSESSHTEDAGATREEDSAEDLRETEKDKEKGDGILTASV